MKMQERQEYRKRIWIPVISLTLALAGLGSCEDLLTNQTGDPRDKLEDTWKVDETAGGLKKSAAGSDIPGEGTGNSVESARKSTGNAKKSALEIYWVEISKHPYDSTRVIIYNFYNVQADAEAILSGNILTLPRQTLEGGYTVRGTGRLQGTGPNEIIWTYRVDDGSGVEDNVTAVYTRLTF